MTVELSKFDGGMKKTDGAKNVSMLFGKIGG